jgi:DNA-binding response OmpR family regulator
VVFVEDEETVREAVERALGREGITVTGFSDYPSPEAVLACAPDLAVLDVLLPSGDGFELACELRSARELPIVFLTARDAVEDRLHGFELGADDYLVKPFVLEELLARVRAVLRRTGRLGAPIQAGDIVVDELTGLAVRAPRLSQAESLGGRWASRAGIRGSVWRTAANWAVDAGLCRGQC